jgi:hypothetical protein
MNLCIPQRQESGWSSEKALAARAHIILTPPHTLFLGIID